MLCIVLKVLHIFAKQTNLIMEQIKGIILNGKDYKITETAYKQLSDYLKYIKRSLKDDEKFSDIEIQISVLLDMESEQKKQKIVTTEIINEVINVMKENQKIKYKQQFYGNEKFRGKTKTKRNRQKLQRDKSHTIIGGVCSGIARKLGVDPLLIRILFILLALFRGLFIPVYIILWIVIPSDENQINFRKTTSL